MVGIIGGAALLTAMPVSFQWSQKNVALSLDSVEAAGFSRRVHLRVYRRAVYGSAVAGVVVGRNGYLPEYMSPPPLTSYYVPPYSFVSSYGFAYPRTVRY
jgi:hypothetical protein